ncbi:MAG: LysR family transcriptional regulator [Parvibaculaceae bacterium]
MLSRPNFTLKQLRYLVAVAECANITEASNRLGVTQSAVSVAVSDLEESISTQLFIRHRAKGARLTPAGAKFLVKARELLHQAADLQDFGAELGQSMRGELNVGCYFMLSPFFVAPILSSIRKAYPYLAIRLFEDRLDVLQQALLNGSCDLAFIYDVDVHAGLHHELLMPYPPYVLVAKGSALAQRESLSLAELAKEPLIMIDLPHSRTYVENLAALRGVELTVAYRVSSFETIRSLVSHGHGYSILNQHVSLEAVQGGKAMIAKPLTDDLPPVTLILAYVEGTRLSRRALAFMEVCRTHFARVRARMADNDHGGTERRTGRDRRATK